MHREKESLRQKTQELEEQPPKANEQLCASEVTIKQKDEALQVTAAELQGALEEINCFRQVKGSLAQHSIILEQDVQVFSKQLNEVEKTMKVKVPPTGGRGAKRA